MSTAAATQPITVEYVDKLIQRGHYDEAVRLVVAHAGVSMEMTLSNTKSPDWDNAYHPHWVVTLRSRTGGVTVDFFDSINAGQKGSAKPSRYSVLACLQWSDPGAFEDFCSEFGSDTDNRKAKKTWKACRKQFLAPGRVVINEGDRALFAAIH